MLTERTFIKALGFMSKENASDRFVKKYNGAVSIEVDVANEVIEFQGGITFNDDARKTSQKVTKPEDLVVLECVDRLLEKGYPAERITLEKTWGAGHGHSGRLDICVYREDGSEYLLIECKTHGKEFKKASDRLDKDGGQLFTYFKFSNKADLLMLYASELRGGKIDVEQRIVIIEEDYRVGDASDFYDKWSKLTKDNGVFEDWVKPYHFQSRALRLDQLKPIEEKDSGFIFNRFLEILRHNVVSDKPNAFNKIFTLFLCKVYDEKTAKAHDELRFQWLEGQDDDVSFQVRLTDLYKAGMKEFLDKEVTDFSEEDFNRKYGHLDASVKGQIYDEIIRLRLEKNNEFAIKEVFDRPSFEENARIVKQVVELLQGYRLRYNKRQQYLSDFFELLLTTGLKQEAGQFFTPVPIAQYIIKSMPLDKLTDEKLEKGDSKELLPYIIDYAAGSGHFLTESMHEMQRLIDAKEPKDYASATGKKIKSWQEDHFDWATDYVYGVEKDYRLVKVGKVGCYLHGDGLANVILSDGLARFDHPEYRGKLKHKEKDFPNENRQFDVLLSNPPYSVSAFKQVSRQYYDQEAFDLYERLTENSSEIECLFIERAKQLLKDGGMAGIILPSSILSNSGIYARARGMTLRYFDIVAITELGSNTFMATGTNTVVLFLRRRNNYDHVNISHSIERSFAQKQDITINGIEKPVGRYVAYVWEGLSYADYLSLIGQQPTEKVQQHELYRSYRKKIKAKKEADFWQRLLEIEQEKLLYFILSYKQRTVLIKSGEKKTEKRFLGYEFSNRRGSEGIHPIKRSSTITECTRLFDEKVFDNPAKASTYVYKAFQGVHDIPIPSELKPHISYVNLVDTIAFDRAEFDQSISLSAKKKVQFESKWSLSPLSEELVEFKSGLWTGKQEPLELVKVLRNTNFAGVTGKLDFSDIAEIEVETKQLESRRLEAGDILIEKSGGSPTQAVGRVGLFDGIEDGVFSFSNFCSRIRVVDKRKLIPFYLWIVLQDLYEKGGTFALQNGVRLLNLDLEGYRNVKVPLPPIKVQEQLVKEIQKLEQQEGKNRSEIERLEKEIQELVVPDSAYKDKLLQDVCSMKAGKTTSPSEISEKGKYPCYGGNGFRGYCEFYTVEGEHALVGRQGALCGNVNWAEGKFHATEHAIVVTADDDVEIKWLYHKLISMNLNQYAKGTAQPGLSVSRLNQLPISTPSFKEQQQIVSKIENVEAQIAKLQDEIDLFPAKKEEILKKYLR